MPLKSFCHESYSNRMVSEQNRVEWDFFGVRMAQVSAQLLFGRCDVLVHEGSCRVIKSLQGDQVHE